MVKTVIFTFPDGFKFPKYYGEKNITKRRTTRMYSDIDRKIIETYSDISRTSCESCPFNYDSIACVLAEDGTDGPWECPFYNKDTVNKEVTEDTSF